MGVKRFRGIAVLAVVAVVAMVLGLVAGRFVRSPAQVAAETAPPPPTALTEPVVRVTIIRSVPVHATVQHRNTTTIQLNTGEAEGGTPVVTSLPATPGKTVAAGDVLAIVGGRPVIALPGRLPAQRTLRTGATGDDVTQLQQALRGIGFGIGDREGMFGAETGQALRRLYEQRGSEVRMHGQEELEAARQAVIAAERTERQASTAVARAQRDLKAAPVADAGRASLADAVTDSETARGYARADLEAARKKLAAATAVAGPQVPFGEIVFIPELPAIVSTSSAAVGQPAGQGALTLSSGALAVAADLSATLLPEVAVDMPARVIAGRGEDGPGKVAAIVHRPPSENGAGSGPVATAVVIPDEPFAEEIRGTDARVRLIVASSAGEVLAVPTAALSTAADGRAQVIVQAGQAQRPVPVATGFSGDGLTEVTPLDGSLEPGDLVLVGVI